MKCQYQIRITGIVSAVLIIFIVFTFSIMAYLIRKYKQQSFINHSYSNYSIYDENNSVDNPTSSTTGSTVIMNKSKVDGSTQTENLNKSNVDGSTQTDLLSEHHLINFTANDDKSVEALGTIDFSTKNQLTTADQPSTFESATLPEFDENLDDADYPSKNTRKKLKIINNN